MKDGDGFGVTGRRESLKRGQTKLDRLSLVRKQGAKLGQEAPVAELAGQGEKVLLELQVDGGGFTKRIVNPGPRPGPRPGHGPFDPKPANFPSILQNGN